jgi:hypothetical protein
VGTEARGYQASGYYFFSGIQDTASLPTNEALKSIDEDVTPKDIMSKTATILEKDSNSYDHLNMPN